MAYAFKEKLHVDPKKMRVEVTDPLFRQRLLVKDLLGLNAAENREALGIVGLFHLAQWGAIYNDESKAAHNTEALNKALSELTAGSTLVLANQGQTLYTNAWEDTKGIHFVGDGLVKMASGQSEINKYITLSADGASWEIDVDLSLLTQAQMATDGANLETHGISIEASAKLKGFTITGPGHSVGGANVSGELIHMDGDVAANPSQVIVLEDVEMRDAHYAGGRSNRARLIYVHNCRSVNHHAKGWRHNQSVDGGAVVMDGWFADTDTTYAASEGLLFDADGNYLESLLLDNVVIRGSHRSNGAKIEYINDVTLGKLDITADDAVGALRLTHIGRVQGGYGILRNYLHIGHESLANAAPDECFIDALDVQIQELSDARVAASGDPNDAIDYAVHVTQGLNSVLVFGEGCRFDGTVHGRGDAGTLVFGGTFRMKNHAHYANCIDWRGKGPVWATDTAVFDDYSARGIRMEDEPTVGATTYDHKATQFLHIDGAKFHPNSGGSQYVFAPYTNGVISMRVGRVYVPNIHYSGTLGYLSGTSTIDARIIRNSGHPFRLFHYNQDFASAGFADTPQENDKILNDNPLTLDAPEGWVYLTGAWRPFGQISSQDHITLSSIAELEASVGAIGQSRTVTDPDRGGTFVWASSGTANGGTVFTDGSSGYWVRVYAGAMQVKWFVSLTAALSAVPSGGKLELDVDATYTTASTISISTPMEIVWNGATLQASANMNEVLNVSASVILDYPTIDCNSLANRGLTIASGASYVVVDHPEIKNALNYAGQANSTVGIRIEDGTSHIGILHPYIHDLEAGAANNKVCRGILISNVSGGAAPRDINLVGGTIENIRPYDSISGIPSGDADGIVIQDFTDRVQVRIVNMHFRNCEKRCIKIQSPGVYVEGIQAYLSRGATTETRAYSIISVYASHTTVRGIQGEGGCWLYAIDVENIAAIAGDLEDIEITGFEVANDPDADTSGSDIVRVRATSGAITGIRTQGFGSNARHHTRVQGNVSGIFDGQQVGTTSSHAVIFDVLEDGTPDVTTTMLAQADGFTSITINAEPTKYQKIVLDPSGTAQDATILGVTDNGDGTYTVTLSESTSTSYSGGTTVHLYDQPNGCSSVGNQYKSVSGYGVLITNGHNITVSPGSGNAGFGQTNNAGAGTMRTIMVDKDYDALNRLSTELERVRASSPGSVPGTSLIPRGLYEVGTDLFKEADAPSEYQTDSAIFFRVSSAENWAASGAAGFVIVYTVDGAANGIRQIFYQDSQPHFYTRSSKGASTWGSWRSVGKQDVLANISDLEASAGGVGQSRFVTDPDRGGLFKWNGTGTANGGTVFTDGAGGYWIRVYEGRVSIKWFGAVADATTISNGTDSSAAIQAALDAFLEVEVPAPPDGFYYRAANLQLSARHKIFGPGRDVYGIIGDGVNPVFKTNTYSPGGGPDTVRGVQIENLRIENENVAAVAMYNSPEWTIRGCRLRTTKAPALDCLYSFSGLLDDCLVSTSGGSSATFTADAGTDTLTSTAHGLSNGDVVLLTSIGTIPGGINTAVSYYVINATANTFQISENRGGSALDITSTGVDTHTWYHIPFAVTLYDNCNGVIVRGGRISGGAAGGAIDIAQSRFVKIDGPTIESSEYGIRASGAVPADVIGNCNQLILRAYLENLSVPVELGKTSTVRALDAKCTLSGQSTESAEFMYYLGRIRGGSLMGNQLVGTGAEYFIRFGYISGSDNDHAVDLDIFGNDIASAAGYYDFDSNLPNNGWRQLILTANRMSFGLDATTGQSHSYEQHGFVKEYTTEPIACTETLTLTSRLMLIPAQTYGGYLDKVEIFEASGSLDGNLSLGNDSDAHENVQASPGNGVDLSGLTLDHGYVNVPITNVSIRAAEPLYLRLDGGTFAQTFRVRITYRL